METGKQSLVITGVSSGIGYALLELLTAQGYFIFGSVRKQSDAERLAAKFKQSFSPLVFDVCDETAVQNSARQVPS